MIDIANVDCSGRLLLLSGSDGNLGGGTGMYELMRETLDCFWMEYSGRGPSGVCMLTARPLKQGMTAACQDNMSQGDETSLG